MVLFDIDKSQDETYCFNRFHGSRQSSVARQLGKIADLPVVETDELIEERRDKPSLIF